jgi:hypothetical protein
VSKQFRIINKNKGLLELSLADLQEVAPDNFLIQRSPVAPSNPIKGQVYFNTSFNLFYGWNGSSWVDLGSQGTTTWLGLLDTPDIYTGYELEQVVVSEDGTKLEFIPRTFIFYQGVPSTEWIVTHPLKKEPSVIIRTSAGDVVEGAIKYININTIHITFNAAFSGSATLN